MVPKRVPPAPGGTLFFKTDQIININVLGPNLHMSFSKGGQKGVITPFQPLFNPKTPFDPLLKKTCANKKG